MPLAIFTGGFGAISIASEALLTGGTHFTGYLNDALAADPNREGPKQFFEFVKNFAKISFQASRI